MSSTVGRSCCSFCSICATSSLTDTDTELFSGAYEPCVILKTTAGYEGPAKGDVSVSSSYKIQPSDQTSVAKLCGSPSRISGLMYSGEPTSVEPNALALLSVLLVPKSPITARPFANRKTFLALRSRWRML